jgi:DNA polymerase-3 subunit delta'
MFDIVFPNLLGQDKICRQLRREIKNRRLAHAYLLAGARGSGKTTLAMNLFMALNCELRAERPAPCLQCPSCLRAQKTQHENLLLISPPHDQLSAQIKVETLREALRATHFPPLNGGVRLILIREAEHLNPAGANALLKTLEEPPPNNLIILTVQETAELLPTLVSRCRRLNVQPLPDKVILRVLRAQGYNEAETRAALSGGSLGQARAADPVKLLATLRYILQQLRPTRQNQNFWELAKELAAPFRGPERLDRLGLTALLELLAQYYRDAAVTGAGRAHLALLPISPKNGVAINEAIDNFNRIRACQRQILENVNPELALTVLLRQLTDKQADINHE